MIKSIVYNGLYKASAIFVPLLTVGYATRVLGPSAYGQAVSIIALMSFFVNISSLPFGAYAVSRLTKMTGDEFNRYSSVFILVSLVISVGASALFFTVLIVNGSYTADLMFFATLGVLVSFGQIDWYFHAIDRFDLLLIRSILIRTLVLFLVFVFVRNETDAGLYTIFLIFLASLPFIFNLVFFLRQGNFVLRGIKTALLATVKPLFQNSFIGFNSSLYTLLPIALAGYFLESPDFANLSIADRIIRLAISLAGSYAIVLLVKHADKKCKERALLLRDAVKFSAILLSLISLTFFLFSELIVKIVAGDGYSDAVMFIKIMSPLIVIIPISGVLINQAFYASGRLQQLSIIVASAAVFAILGSIFLIYNYGEKGYLITVIFSELWLFFCLMYFSFKGQDFRIQLSYILKPVLSACLIAWLNFRFASGLSMTFELSLKVFSLCAYILLFIRETMSFRVQGKNS